MWTKAFQSLSFEQKTAFTHGFLDMFGGFRVAASGGWLRPAYSVAVLADH